MHLVAAGSMHCVCLTGMTLLSLHKLYYAAFMLHLVLFSMNVNIHVMQITNWLHIVLLGCTQLLCVITGSSLSSLIGGWGA